MLEKICSHHVLIPVLSSLTGVIVWLIRTFMARENEIRSRLAHIEKQQIDAVAAFTESIHSIALTLQKMQGQSDRQNLVLGQISRTLDKTINKIEQLQRKKDVA